MEPLIIEQSRWRLGLLSLFFMCVSCYFGFMLYGLNSSSHGIDLFRIFTILFLGIFGSVTVLALIQAFSRKPQMMLSDEGIFDYNLKMGVLPWSEITGAQVRQTLNHENVLLEVRSPEQCRQRACLSHVVQPFRASSSSRPSGHATTVQGRSFLALSCGAG